MGRLIVFSGAGLSAESGLATFRAEDGLWANYSIEQVCNFLTWKANYEAVHKFYNMRRAKVGAAEPNSAHRWIATWQQRYDVTILTQNIDDLLERAGCADVIHLHGRVQEMLCTACGYVWNIGYRAWGGEDRCMNFRCNSREGVKPNVVSFNEGAPQYRHFRSSFAALQTEDVVLVTGTSGNVIQVDQYLLGRPGYKIFNALEATFGSAAYDMSILRPATEAFPVIDQLLQERLGAGRSQPEGPPSA